MVRFFGKQFYMQSRHDFDSFAMAAAMSNGKILLSALINYAANNLIQRQIIPRIIEYIYTKSISPIENIF